MAYTENARSESYQSAGNLSGSQYRAVVMDASGRVGVIGVAGARPDGILQNAPLAAGQPAEVQRGGSAKWLAGGAFNIGDPVMSDNQGRCVLYVVAAGNVRAGKARLAGVAGAIVSVSLELD
jgi:hypothetical protein